GNCGAQNADNAAFCKNCGAQLNAAPQQPQQQPVYQQPYYAAPKKPLNTKLIGIIAGAAAAVVLAVVLLIVLLGGGSGAGSAEAAAEKFVEAAGNMDADDLLNLVHEDTLEYLADDLGYDDIDEMREEMEESADEAKEMMGGISMKVSAEAGYIEKPSKHEMQGVKEMYDEEFGLEVTDAAEVEVEMTLKVSYAGETFEESSTVDVCVVEIDGTWYLDVFNFDMSQIDIY
ncbi:MAG: zinc ribbon domain-containing protein, partial [Clostridia bacterium]|nr:zinc ribbon domain-containing protein [Clostridia bacterium]